MNRDRSGRSLDLPIKMPAPLAWFAFGVPLLWLLSIAFVLVERLVFHNAKAASLPHHFDDFASYWRRLPLVHTTAFFSAPDNPSFGSGWGYPAPAIWIYRFFYLFDPIRVQRPNRGLLVMDAVALAVTAFAAYRFSQALHRRGLRWRAANALAAVAFALSWPLFFAIQRGNIEMILWLPIAAAAWAIHARRSGLAAVLIGITASVKLYPIILLAVLFRDRRYLQICYGILLPITITLVSLWYIGPTLPYAIIHLGLGVGGFLQEHGAHIDWSKEGFNHSFFHLIKIAMEHHPELLQSVLPRYMGVAALVMTVLFFTRVIRLPLLNQLTVLILSMVYLPATSYDYTLQALLVPFAWLALLIVSSAAKGSKLAGATAAMVLFTLLLGPEMFLAPHEYTHAGTFKCLCLGALLLLACIYPWRDPAVDG